MWPIFCLQSWLASQAWSLGQVSSVRPAGTALQVPSLPATLQGLQVPAHCAAVWAQQTPSTQLPDMQVDALAAEQPDPFGRGMVLARYSQISCGPYVESAATVPPKTSVVALSASKIWMWL